MLALISVAGCKKYGYAFRDGYENGEDNATMPPGQTDSLSADFSKIREARIFPGLVGASEPRLKNKAVTIDFSKRYVPSTDIRVVSTPQPFYSTGLYAPAGEPVTIEVPQGTEGIIAMVGGWTDNLSGIAQTKRDPLIFSQIGLRPGKNYIRNLYGGTIYLRTNGTVKSLGTVTVTFSGAVQSPDFVLGETSDAAWNESVHNSTVPWFQLRGKRIIFELPKIFVDKHPISNPTALMEEWDRIIEEDIYRWKGLADDDPDSLNRAPNHPIRVIMDVQPRLSYAHNSFPVVIQMDENLFVNEITDLSKLTTKGAWRTLYEIGRNNSTYFWLFSSVSPAAANLFSIKMAHRLQFGFENLHPGMKLAIDTGLLYAKQKKIITSSFSRDITQRTNADLIRLLPFIQLFEVYGYDMLQYIDYRARQYNLSSLSDQQKVNFFYTCASEFAQTDLSAFFRAWAIPVSPDVTDSVGTKFPYLTKTIFEYNPITKTGIRDSVMPPPREIDRVSWQVIGFCCQETDNAAAYASNLLDGNVASVWHSQWKLNAGQAPHFPHYITFDMGKIFDVGGFFYINSTSQWRPKNIKIYLSWDNMTWVTAWTGAGWNVGDGVYNSANFGYRYNGVRYVRFEMNESFPGSANNAVCTGEFGVLTPVAAQVPSPPPSPEGEEF